LLQFDERVVVLLHPDQCQSQGMMKSREVTLAIDVNAVAQQFCSGIVALLSRKAVCKIDASGDALRMSPQCKPVIVVGLRPFAAVAGKIGEIDQRVRPVGYGQLRCDVLLLDGSQSLQWRRRKHFTLR
jgi:hypothetical protein